MIYFCRGREKNPPLSNVMDQHLVSVDLTLVKNADPITSREKMLIRILKKKYYPNGAFFLQLAMPIPNPSLIKGVYKYGE